MAVDLAATRLLSNYAKTVVLAVEVIAFLYAVYLLALLTARGSEVSQVAARLEEDPAAQVWIARNKKNVTFVYTRESRLVWIGGVPRSGTTLMRVILDAHKDIRCGAETRILPAVLSAGMRVGNNPNWADRFAAAGVTKEVTDDAMASLVMQILLRYDEPAKLLCVKDPFAFVAAGLVHYRLFPNSKFILMLRDGRATVHSIISRQVSISGYEMKDYGKCLQNWNRSISNMLHDCMHLGEQFCMPVHYESLVLDTEKWVRKIAQFLQVPFDSRMLKHYTLIGEEDGIHVSNKERSTDQVSKPIYTSALTDWLAAWPPDVLEKSLEIAPMLRILGYDVKLDAPDYSSLSLQYKNLLKSWNANSLALETRRRNASSTMSTVLEQLCNLQCSGALNE